MKRIINTLMYCLKAIFYWPWCKLQNISFQWGWKLDGFSQFREVGQGAKIRIGQHFTTHSASRGNSIGINQPVIQPA
jgi:hypothetical protein